MEKMNIFEKAFGIDMLIDMVKAHILNEDGVRSFK